MTQKQIIIVILLSLSLIALKLLHRPAASETEFASQVLDQYIRYFCPRDGICDHSQGLKSLRLAWPNVYQAGFSILEDEKN